MSGEITQTGKKKVKLSTSLFLSSGQVAKKLGVSVIRVQQFIRDGRLKAMKVGRNYVIKESDLVTVSERKVGRPSSFTKLKTKG